jgi:hypothetical protein
MQNFIISNTAVHIISNTAVHIISNTAVHISKLKEILLEILGNSL